MLRTLKLSLRSADQHVSRRRRFVPSVGGTTSALEDRALLSTMGGLAGHAAAHHLASHTPPPNGSVPPIIANSTAAGADVAYPVRPNPPHAPVGTLPGQGRVPRSKLTLPDGAPTAVVLAAHPASSQSLPPNATGAPASSNPFTGSSTPPNGSVGPIIA